MARLESAGLLKRAGKQERCDTAYLLALAEKVTGQWKCPSCDSSGMSVAVAEETTHGSGRGRPCAACGNLIPAERLELFPEMALCVTCQSAVDRGQPPDTQEFCPRCGNRMQIRTGRGAGVARYALVCPQCRR